MSKQCKDLYITECLKLAKKDLCQVYERNGKKCRKKANARELNAANFVDLVSPVRRVGLVGPNVDDHSITEEIIRHIFNQNTQTMAVLIDSLEINPSDSIRDIIKAPFMTNHLEVYLNKPERTEKEIQTFINAYEILTSENMNTLLKTIPIDGKTLKKNILSWCNALQKKADIAPAMIFLDIFKYIKNLLNTSKPTNASVVFQTSKNVLRTEEIEKLGIHTFESLFTHFTDISVLDKASASDSIVISAKLKQTPDMNVVKARNVLKPIRLFFKIYPRGNVLDSNGFLYDYSNNGMDFERQAYEELYKLVKYNITPNILCKVATAELSNFQTAFLGENRLYLDENPHDPTKKTNRKKLLDQFKKFNERNELPLKTLWDDVGMIVTQPGGITLKDYIQNFTQNDVDDFKKIMFQILYTFYVFEKIEFSHGDIHHGNIFIINVPETELCYLINDILYKFKTTKLVKIYDFDHGIICKNTSIVLDTTESFTINKLSNDNIRGINGWGNQQFAETNIFNKNLDRVIFFLNFSSVPGSLNQFGHLNPTFDKFLKDVLPGMNSSKSESQKKISTKYAEILSKPKNNETIEMTRIFGTDNMAKFYISQDVLQASWLVYFNHIHEDSNSLFNRIIKRTSSPIVNNQLYIPDSVVLTTKEMISHPYFDELKSADAIDVSTDIIYNIDKRIIS